MILDPYAPIEKRPLVTHDGMASKGYTVRRQDPSEPVGWKEVGVVSENYLLVPNGVVREMAHDIANQSGYAWEERKTVFDGRRYSLALVSTEAARAEVRVGDVVSLGMLYQNSFDGSQRLSVSLFVNRLACSNGMLAHHLFKRVTFKHHTRSLGWEDELRRALSVLATAHEGLLRFATAAARLDRMELTAARLRTLRKGPLAAVPVTLWGRVLDQCMLREELTLWGLLNAATATTWHDAKLSPRDLEHNASMTRALIDFGAAA